MSQFTTKDGTTLISSMWPTGLPVYIKGDTDIASLHAAGALVPTHEDAMRAWCFVATNADNHDRTRNKILAHCSTGEDDVREVAFRFQGFVKQAELGVYGTWDGKRETVVKAVQALTIFGGNSREVFAAQVNSANLVRRLVVEDLHGQYAASKNLAIQLEFTHAVFSKVKPTDTRAYKAPADLARDLSRHAERIQQEWRVLGGVRVGVQEQNGVRPATGREIRRGDFVDVTAALNIHQRRRFNATNTFVSFRPIRVVRLATAMLVKQLHPQQVTESVPSESSTEAAHGRTPPATRKIVPAEVEL